MARKVLVLDDDIAVLEAIESALTYEDFEVVTLGRSYNIIKSIDEAKPDVVLLDFMLDGMSGGEMCRQIKSNEATLHIPVIIISAYQGDAEALYAYGCDLFIPKPFDLAELNRGLERVLSKSAEKQDKALASTRIT